VTPTSGVPFLVTGLNPAASNSVAFQLRFTFSGAYVYSVTTPSSLTFTTNPSTPSNPTISNILPGFNDCTFTIAPYLLPPFTSYDNVGVVVYQNGVQVASANVAGSSSSASVVVVVPGLLADTEYSAIASVFYASTSTTVFSAVSRFGTIGTEIVPVPAFLKSGFLIVPPASATTLTFPDIDPALNSNSTVLVLMVSSTAGDGDAASAWIVSSVGQEQFGGSIKVTLAASPTGTLTLAYHIGAYNGLNVTNLPGVTYPLATAPPDIVDVYSVPFPASSPVNGGCAQIVVNVTNTAVGGQGFIFYVYTPDALFARVDVGVSTKVAFRLNVPGLTLFRVAYTSYASVGAAESQMSNKFPLPSTAPLLITLPQSYDLAPQGQVSTAAYSSGTLALTITNIPTSVWITSVSYIVRSNSGLLSFTGATPWDAGVSTAATQALNIPITLTSGDYHVQVAYTNQFSTSTSVNSLGFNVP
jgi:hypothetical protein